MSERPCYYVSEPGVGRVLIPGCWGSAVYGKSQCTCAPPRIAKYTPDMLEKIEARLAAVEKLLSGPKDQGRRA